MNVITAPEPPTFYIVTSYNGSSVSTKWDRPFGTSHFKVTTVPLVDPTKNVTVNVSGITYYNHTLDETLAYAIVLVACNKQDYCSDNLSQTVIIIPDCKYSPCDEKATCKNGSESVQCNCSVGYTGNGVVCSDIIECDEPNMCTSFNDSKCVNTIGSFACECESGFEGNYTNCTDVNECENTNGHNCSANATCANIVGSYLCSCNTGYSGDGYLCIDINECNNTHNCSDNASCLNTQGSYNCLCEPGFTGDGYNCTDYNECTNSSNLCSRNANCTNTNGSYSCQCWKGFSGNGVVCNDINECLPIPCHLNGQCNNTIGSFSCQCKQGYTGNGFNCNDINECLFSPCPGGILCINTPGSYFCNCPNTTDNALCTCSNTTDLMLCAEAQFSQSCPVQDSCLQQHQPDGVAVSYTCTCVVTRTNPCIGLNNTATCPANYCDESINVCAKHINTVCNRDNSTTFTCQCPYGSSFTSDTLECTSVLAAWPFLLIAPVVIVMSIVIGWYIYTKKRRRKYYVPTVSSRIRRWSSF